ncbi:hypothetical protein D9611_012441 [Ephemerocybe angulata]|uniref:Ribonucleoside-diphosphate reductase n=1 Tax=Ephemerocybe angulata TaxID=980116 RepID=A0A8H5CFW1_9AGAR|nr:hypothetical protein D9611_012441 [Tulosesus angulatus]
MLVVSCRREMGGSPSFFLVVECTHIIRRPRSIEEYDGFKVLVSILKPRLIRRLALLMGDRMVHEGCIAALDTLCQLGASSFGLAVDSSSIDRRLAKLSASLEPQGSIYGIISSALEMDALYQSTEGTFSGAMKAAYSKGLLAPEFMNEVDRCAPVLDSLIRPDGDQHFTYSALRLLQKSYLLRYGQALYERPQYMWLRVAVYLHSGDMDSIRLFYSHMSTFKVVPSASVLCQSGTQDPPSHPCYQYDMSGCPDELFRLMKTISTIGRAGGNIGIGMQNMPAQSSLVDGLKRSGVVHALHSLKACMRVMDRGLDAPELLVKVYLEPWHAEIEGFLRTVRLNKQGGCIDQGLRYGLMLNSLLHFKDYRCSNACDPFPRLSFSPEGVTGVPTAFPKHLLELLESKGLWNNRIRECILRNQGSIQGIDCIPIHIRDRYKTAWDVDPAVVLQMAVDRAPAICQSQSVTLCLADPSVSQLTTFVYKCWRSGMKTGLFRIYAPIRGSFSSGRISSVRDGGDDGSSAFVAGTGTVSDPLIMNGL